MASDNASHGVYINVYLKELMKNMFEFIYQFYIFDQHCKPSPPHLTKIPEQKM